MTTELALAWESDEKLRKKARLHALVEVAGDRITRDALATNESVIVKCINIIGSRVSVDVLTLHIQSLYAYMKLDVPSQTAHLQAWYLRRCLSEYNSICRRPHLPRELHIQRLMVETGIDLTNYGPASREDLVVDQDDGEDCEDDFGVEETGEEEEREVDEVVEIEAPAEPEHPVLVSKPSDLLTPPSKGPSLPEVTPDPVQRETRLRKLQELTTYLETLHRLKECKKIQESARFVDIPSQVCLDNLETQVPWEDSSAVAEDSNLERTAYGTTSSPTMKEPDVKTSDKMDDQDVRPLEGKTSAETSSTSLEPTVEKEPDVKTSDKMDDQDVRPLEGKTSAETSSTSLEPTVEKKPDVKTSDKMDDQDVRPLEGKTSAETSSTKRKGNKDNSKAPRNSAPVRKTVMKKKNKDKDTSKPSSSGDSDVDCISTIYFSKRWLEQLTDCMEGRKWEDFVAHGKGKIFHFEKHGLEEIPEECHFPLRICISTPKESASEMEEVPQEEPEEEVEEEPEEEHDEDEKPGCWGKVPYIHPDQQCPPKKRGRKPKNKDESKTVKSKSKTSRKKTESKIDKSEVSASNVSKPKPNEEKRKRKYSKTPEEDVDTSKSSAKGQRKKNPESKNDAAATNDSESKKTRAKRSRREDDKGEDEKKNKTEAEPRQRQGKRKAQAKKAPKSGKTKADADEDVDEKDIDPSSSAKPKRKPLSAEAKAKASRKSSAYHNAFRKAKAEGKSQAECKEAASKAYAATS